jgi:hypothetical protein
MSNGNYRTVIKQQHVRHREVTVLAGLVVFGLVFIVGYIVGQGGIPHGYGTESGASNAALSGAEQELQILQEEFEVQRIQHRLDSSTLELVRKEIASQKDQIAKLEEGLRFYKGLMAPEEIAQGLSLRALELMATERSGHFMFRIIAQQEALKHPTLKGSLSIEVFGLRGDEEVSYPLADLSEDIEDNTVTLRFRYFQSIEGELVLPDGFDPGGFRVIARAISPRKVELREQFPWEVQERFSYVGK